MTETMTMHKALIELKLCKAKIQKTLFNDVFTGVITEREKETRAAELSALKESILASAQSTNDNIKRYAAIKAAIIQSNAQTKITIAEGKITMTVAAAIDFRANIIPMWKDMLNSLSASYKNSMDRIQAHNEQLEIRADTSIQQIINSTPNSTSDTQNYLMDYRNKLIEQNEAHLVDPLNITQKMNEINEMILSMDAEIDAALSVSNAITEITVTWESKGYV